MMNLEPKKDHRWLEGLVVDRVHDRSLSAPEMNPRTAVYQADRRLSANMNSCASVAPRM